MFVVLGAAVLGSAITALVMERPAPLIVAPAPAPPPKAIAAPASRLVCARDRDPDDERPVDCSAATLRADVCEARLDECSREKRGLRRSWPTDGAPSERPGEFQRAIEAALGECGLVEDLELLECTEYPCVAALRRPADVDPTVAAERLTAAAVECPALRDAFGLDADRAAAGGIQVNPVRVPCGADGGDEHAYVLSAFDPSGEAWAMWQARGEGDNLTEALRWMFRRGDDVAALWDCE